MAGTFTTNKAQAAVILDLKKIKKGVGQAVILNSGNANACTGRLGMKNAQEMENGHGN
ncbi:MAG: bifunctional ornithine acetyltransferase/N-acetylglutamate synthase [bacterium]